MTPAAAATGSHGTDSTTPVTIAGAGLAGCWLARILAERNIPVLLLDAKPQAASAASANPAGIVKPFVTRTPSLPMSFYTAAHAFLIDKLARWELSPGAGFMPCGVLQLVRESYPDAACFTSLDPQAASKQAGLTLNSAALLFDNSGWLNPQALCRQLIRHPMIEQRLGTKIKSITRVTQQPDPCWTVLAGDGTAIDTEHLILACGASLQQFDELAPLPLTPARGQLSRFSLAQGSDRLSCVVNGKHYVIPDHDSVLVGATFERNRTDTAITAEDHASNLAGLRTLLPSLHVAPDAIEGFAGIRATTPDRMPLIGPVPDFSTLTHVYADICHGKPADNYPALPVLDGLHLIGGLGSRGIVTAPYTASLLADYLMGCTPNDSNLHTIGNAGQNQTGRSVESLEYWASLINPARFAIRNLKRGLPAF